MCRYYTSKKEAFLTIQFNKPEYKKDRCNYVPKMINIEAAKTFLSRKSKELTSILNAQFSDITKAQFKIDYWRGDIEWEFVMNSNCAFTDDELKQIKSKVEDFQKTMAVEFNAQPFATSEYGIVRFPKRGRNGICLYR